MKSPYDIIKRPVITEQSMAQMAERKYTFEVDPRANKTEIKKAVEAIFKVEVESVNTMRLAGKLKRMGVHVGRTPQRKKAIVTLKPTSKGIEFFEGLNY